MGTTKSTAQDRSLLDRIFRDKDGNIVIGQFPNVPLVVWGACMVVSVLLPEQDVSAKIARVGTAFGFIWAYLEATQGVNVFRRGIGIVALIALTASIFVQ